MAGLYDYSNTEQPSMYDAMNNSVRRANAYADQRRLAGDNFIDAERQLTLRDMQNAPGIRRYEFDQGLGFKQNALAQLLGRQIPNFFAGATPGPFSGAQIEAQSAPSAAGASYGGGMMPSRPVMDAGNNFLLRLLSGQR